MGIARRFEGLSRKRLDEIIERIKKVKVVLIGDICVDIYWSADMTKSELSRETPHYPLPVVQERISPGAGGNAAANLMALAPQQLSVIGVVGDDWRAGCVRDAFVKLGMTTDGLVEEKGRFTNAYCKPMRFGYAGIEVEDPRLDFEGRAPIAHETELLIAEKLVERTADADVLCVSDQFMNGCITPFVREQIFLLAQKGLKVVVDSRYRIGDFKGVILKPNEIECSRAVGIDKAVQCKTEEDIATIVSAAETLADKNRSDVCVTVGEHGCITIYGKEAVFVPSVSVEPPVDTVGAGDCFLSAFSLALAAGATYEEAGAFANLAASVSVKKIGVTGTASPQELIGQYEAMFGQKL
ncbi:MAG: sugar kinase [Ruminococcaceae bacterium]|nr:sugar kinase [Oscillospiraceae bacterium]